MSAVYPDPEQFDAGYQESMREPEARGGIDSGALAHKLMAEYKEAANARTLVEQRWLADLQQYKGQYSAAVLTHLKATKRSSVYYRLTTFKVNTMVARLMDLLFPQRSKNWSLENTPDPMLPDDVIKAALQEEIAATAQGMLESQAQHLAEQGIIPDAVAIQKMQMQTLEAAFQQLNTPEARLNIAKDRASLMERVIDDQLKENNVNGTLRPSWQSNCKDVVGSACLYGMGILKGPLVERVETKRFDKDHETGKWQEQTHSEDLKPYHEAVSIWSIFPEPDVMRSKDLRYVWQVHLKSDKDLLELANFPGFDGEAIRAHRALHPEGDANLETWEQYLQTLDMENLNPGTMKNRYRVYERWGFLSGKELSEAGVDVPEADHANVYSSNIWIVGNRVIKAAINPLEGIDIPYYFYPYQKDDSSFWPEGIASLLRAPQAGINATVRAMQDNAAASSGPIYGLNLAYLAHGEDINSMIANRVFQFDKPGD